MSPLARCRQGATTLGEPHSGDAERPCATAAGVRSRDVARLPSVRAPLRRGVTAAPPGPRERSGNSGTIMSLIDSRENGVPSRAITRDTRGRHRAALQAFQGGPDLCAGAIVGRSRSGVSPIALWRACFSEGIPADRLAPVDASVKAHMTRTVDCPVDLSLSPPRGIAENTLIPGKHLVA